MSSFTAPFRTEWLTRSGLWLILHPFEFHSGEKDSGLFIRCERGQTTDLASIPWWIRWLIPKVGRDAQGAAIHDVGYRTGAMSVRFVDSLGVEHVRSVPVSRGMVDAMYWQAMVVLDTGLLRREVIYRGLQVFGWWTWNRYRREERELHAAN